MERDSDSEDQSHHRRRLGVAPSGMSARLSRVRRLLALPFALIAVMALAGVAAASELPPGGSFIDDDGKYYEPSIEAIYENGITVGCSDRGEYCPEDPVTREQMATFLARALNLGPAEDDYFSDDSESPFEDAINRIAEADITSGCNPPDNDQFCPDRPVSREEMATFMVRAFGLDDPDQWDLFVDDDGSVHERNIDRLGHARITVGCNPPDNDEFCPRDDVTRGQMAVFLTRAIPLQALTPPERPPTHLVSRYTTYHASGQPRVTNIHVMARLLDGWVVLPGETFDLWDVIGKPTESKGYVPAPILLDGEGYCCDHPLNIGGGTSQFGTTLYNAFFWGGYDEVQHKPHSQYISRYPVGIEATLGYPSLNVVFVNDTFNPITIDTSYTSSSITVSLWANNDGRTFVGRWSGGPRHTITSSGGSDARVVTATVSGFPNVRIDRYINGSLNDTWFWNYVD